METEVRTLLMRWKNNCLRSQIANYDAANTFSRRNYWLGVPTIAITAVVGTAVFSSLKDSAADPLAVMFVGGISILASVLTSLQTFFHWGELAAAFRSTASAYGALKREIDEMLALEADVDARKLSAIRETLDTLSREGPEVPRRIWERALKTIPIANVQSNNSLETDT